MMRKRLEKLLYINEDKFGIKDYRLPIVWVDKLLLVGASGAWRRVCGSWRS